MNPKFLTLIAFTALTLTATSATFAKTNNNSTVTVLDKISPITGIEAHGNVEVYITNGCEDGVKVFDNYYNQNAMVQNENGVLRVTSYKSEKLVIEVTVTDLRSITATDNAVVKSFGRFSSLDLEVKLNDNALATIDVDGPVAKFTINDRAKADISGSIEDYQLNYSRSSTVNRTYLSAANRTEIITTPLQRSKINNDAGNLASL